jgi:hypothetical protein
MKSLFDNNLEVDWKASWVIVFNINKQLTKNCWRREGYLWSRKKRVEKKTKICCFLLKSHLQITKMLFFLMTLIKIIVFLIYYDNSSILKRHSFPEKSHKSQKILIIHILKSFSFLSVFCNINKNQQKYLFCLCSGISEISCSINSNSLLLY